MDFAFSIPTSQQDCDFDAPSTMSTTFVVVPNSSVTVNNGNLSRDCINSFNAGATTGSEGDGVEVTYAISSQGGTCQSGIGPQSFHAGNDSGGFFFAETYTSITVCNLGPGVHTIQPCWVLIDLDGDGREAILARRCLVVECRTR